MSEPRIPSDELYTEACRLVGQCCLMLAQNNAETTRERLVYQLKRLHWQMMEQHDESNQAILLAIEQLTGEG